MDKMEDKLLYGAESYGVVEAAIQVWKTLGYGFLEKVYENALSVEFLRRAIPFERQKSMLVHYNGEVVGDYVADMVVGHKIILELKSARAIDDSHIAQTLNYLKATGLRLGIILNFGPAKLDFKRVIR
jgi:GxxExxY protein